MKNTFDSYLKQSQSNGNDNRLNNNNNNIYIYNIIYIISSSNLVVRPLNWVSSN